MRLAADTSGRRAELYVRGTRPISWVKSTRSSVRQQLRRYRNELAAYEQRFGDPDVPVRQFVSGEAAHVQLIDLEQRLPALFTAI